MLVHGQFLKGWVMPSALVVIQDIFKIWIQSFLFIFAHFPIFAPWCGWHTIFLWFYSIITCSMCDLESTNSSWATCSQCLHLMNARVFYCSQFLCVLSKCLISQSWWSSISTFTFDIEHWCVLCKLTKYVHH